MPTRHEGSEREVLSLNAFIALMRSVDALEAKLYGNLSRRGVPIADFAILQTLYYGGSMCQKEISRKVFRSKASISLTLDRLAARSLVRRIPSDRDKRYVSVELTPAGRRHIEKVLPGHIQDIEEALLPASDTELIALRDICQRIGRTAELQLAGGTKSV